MKMEHMGRMDIIEGINQISPCIEQRRCMTACSIYNRQFVMVKPTSEFDEDYCKENGIECVRFPGGGGALVVNEGDVGLVCVFPMHRKGDVLKEFLTSFVSFLVEHGIDARAEDNDVLIDGNKKVSGAHYVIINEMRCFAAHISLSVDMDRIVKICKKRILKVPEGLSGHGLTSEDVIGFAEGFIRDVESRCDGDCELCQPEPVIIFED